MIQIEGLHYAYPTLSESEPSPWVLRGVNLSLERGECVGVMGPTGAGKSTLALSLLGIIPQSFGGRIRGRVRVAGKDARSTPVAEMARSVGLVFQDPETQFLASTVEDELAFGLESFGVPRPEMRRRITRALADVGMSGQEQRTPHDLSGGEMQRVAIAAVLAMEPDVLVLDEPAANLDPRGEAEFFALLDELRRGDTTILLFSNNADRVASLTDRVAVLAEGQIQLEGTASEIFRQMDRMKAFGLPVPQLAVLAECLADFTDQPMDYSDPERAALRISELLKQAAGRHS
ncbi:MAG: ATP-binding cassette domain-containing protein [Anaerolineales bacterium]|nr:ATP-binding cassette domain-containing protein [Anaerolineales bacterium]